MGELLKNKVCLITGTSKGIGKCIAETFASQGAVVYANARTEGCLDEWAILLNSSVQGEIIPIYFDISQSDEIRGAVQQLKKAQTQINFT